MTEDPTVAAAVTPVLATKLAAGARMGPYRIVEHLGQGGMGDVYRAHDDGLDRPVALKTISPRFAADEEFLARFRTEAKAAARVNHPNVVQNYFCGEQDGTSFFAMELVEGTSLGRELARRKALPWREATQHVLAAARGLEAAHRAGVLHRDVKPDNLLLSKDGVVKVADFGLAKRDSEASQTATGVVVGTPRYMSPEQAQAQTLDLRSDIYSLGATLFHLVAGRPLFDGASAVVVCSKHIHEPPPRLEAAPPGLAATVARMLAKKPEERFATWAETASALEAALRVDSEANAPTTLEAVNLICGAAAPKIESQPASRTDRVLMTLADSLLGPAPLLLYGVVIAGSVRLETWSAAVGVGLVASLVLGRSIGERLMEVELVTPDRAPPGLPARVAAFFLVQTNGFVALAAVLPWNFERFVEQWTKPQVIAALDFLSCSAGFELLLGLVTGRSLLERIFGVRLLRRLDSKAK